MNADPWNWSVTDVQSFFRDRAAGYIADLPHARLPPFEPFLKTLGENDVNGAILLTAIDSSALKDDCGLSSLGFRGAVIRCITKLRRESAKYSFEYDTQRLQTPISPLTQIQQPVPSPQEAVLPYTENARSGEVQIQDAHGRKRRKLDLSRVEPLQRPVSGQGYLDDAAYTVDKLFYGPTGFGQEIEDLPPAGDVLVYDTDKEAELENQNFQFIHQGKPLGERYYVHAQMRHFLANAETVDLVRHEKAALAFLPYRDGVNQRGRSATVLHFGGRNQEIIAIKENAAHLERGQSLDEQMQQPAGEWEFLVQKHKNDEDELLPVYGESESDDAEGLTQGTEADGEDMAEEESDPRFVDQERVAELIEDAIEQYTADWHEILPGLEAKKAWKVWKKTKQSRTLRQVMTESAQAKIEHLTTRLNKMKSRMLEAVWPTEQSVLKACASLEVTVEDREEQRWMITIWKRRQDPAHISHHGTKSRHPGLPTPLTGEKGERDFVVHPNDRFSVSPAAVATPLANVQTEEEIRYEADDEEFHTPTGSPKVSPDAADVFSDAPDDMILGAEEAFDDGSVMGGPEVDLPGEATAVLNGVEHTSSDKDDRYSPDIGGSDTDELPSPSTFVKRKSQPPTSIMPIDLTFSSDSSPPNKRGRPSINPKGRPKTRPIEPRGNAMDASVSDVDSWNFYELAKTNDRLRILIKRLHEAGSKFRERLDTCLRTAGRQNFGQQIQAACQAHRQGSLGETSLTQDNVQTMLQAGRIFLHWAFPTYTEQQTKIMDKITFDSALSVTQVSLFTQMLASCLQKKTSKLFIHPKLNSSKHTSSSKHGSPSKPNSSSAPIPISSSDDKATQDLTPHKKRKREIARSSTAMNSRIAAFQREKRFNESQTTELAAMIPSSQGQTNTAINPAKVIDGAQPIYICDRIANKMKPHQVEGARFLWREITADDADGAQGCVLAHTMGLGKTMQTIALLVAVNEAAHSEKQTIRQQLPSHLRPKGIRERELRFLILCPPALIQNWHREIEEWAPREIRSIFSLDSASKSPHVDQLEQWMRFGGIVLLGYQMFRAMVTYKAPKANQKNPRSEADYAKLQEMLLQGTELVVADEAHNLKNDKSDIAIAANQIETPSRIGLTGTPMSNDVQEIYALVSWVAPDYLGDPTEFRAHFAEPIQQGLWQDSSAYERRKSIMKLKVLQAEIHPKVNRANIEVLRGSLRPKVEFVITVPLGEVQTEIYRRYIATLLSADKKEKASQVTIFAWLAILTLLTNHPRCFRAKLLAPPPPARRPSKHGIQDGEGNGDTSGTATPNPHESGSVTPAHEGIIATGEQLSEAEAAKKADEEHVYALGFSEAMVQQILNGFGDDMDPKLSAKVTIFLNLLNYTLECGDKALVFSSSIPTLNFLDELLQQQGKGFGRIDGSTTMAKRMQALEEFHKHEFDIMLVSTKAGGVGLNIQGANRVFIFDFGFNPTWEEQAIGRAYRLGQTKPVYVYRFLAGGTFETNIYNKQLFKSSLAQRVVDKKNPRRNAERNTREYLYEPKPVAQTDLNEWAGKDPQVLDRLLGQHGSEDGKFDTMIRAISTMETLQEEAVDAPLDEEEQKEVNLEIEQGRLRPRGRKAMNASTAVPSRTHANGHIVRLPLGQRPPNAASASRPPLSTYAGTSGSGGPQPFPMGSTQPHPMGGLPLPRMQQPYQG